MFDIGWSELLLIGIVALIVIGPKELPGTLRTLGQWMGKMRRMAGEFQDQFREAMREAELADLKKEVDEMATKAQSYAHFDPMEDVRRDLEKAAGDLPALDSPSASEAPTPVPEASQPANTETAPAGIEPAPTPPPSEPSPSGPAQSVENTDADIKGESGRAPA